MKAIALLIGLLVVSAVGVSAAGVSSLGIVEVGNGHNVEKVGTVDAIEVNSAKTAVLKPVEVKTVRSVRKSNPIVPIKLEDRVQTSVIMPADFNEDGVVNSKDFIAFLNAWNSEDLSADLNEDGNLDNVDFGVYRSLFTADGIAADFNHDGVKNSKDFVMFLDAWNSGGLSPEDSSADLDRDGDFDDDDFNAYLCLFTKY